PRERYSWGAEPPICAAGLRTNILGGCPCGRFLHPSSGLPRCPWPRSPSVPTAPSSRSMGVGLEGWLSPLQAEVAEAVVTGGRGGGAGRAGRGAARRVAAARGAARVRAAPGAADRADGALAQVAPGVAARRLAAPLERAIPPQAAQRRGQVAPAPRLRLGQA